MESEAKEFKEMMEREQSATIIIGKHTKLCRGWQGSLRSKGHSDKMTRLIPCSPRLRRWPSVFRLVSVVALVLPVSLKDDGHL